MEISKTEIYTILRRLNPWWRGEPITGLPVWRRSAFKELEQWIKQPPVHRALLLGGSRQIGKTTLLLQSIQSLMEAGTKSNQILYVTFDHPILKSVGLETVIDIWEESEGTKGNRQYLFLDEIQYKEDWQTWIKHQVDFEKYRQIVMTGSAMPLHTIKQESGVGRWYTIKLPTLSFYEYLQIKAIPLPKLMAPACLLDLFEWKDTEFVKVADVAKPLAAYFNEYLLCGGFPQTAKIDDVYSAQKLLREDIIDKILKRDMTDLFGVRHINELEKIFAYLCMHEGGLLDIPGLCKNLQLTKPTAHNFIDLLEATYLLYKLSPYGYGKEILRGRFKLYLADAAISPSIMLQGKSLLEDATKLGVAAESTVFKHLYTRSYRRGVRFSYWKEKKGQEVDIIAEVENKLIPFEVKYRTLTGTNLNNLKGLVNLCKTKRLQHAFVVTRDINDFCLIDTQSATHIDGLRLLKIPAVLLCYWVSQPEIDLA